MRPLESVCVFAGPSLPLADRIALPGVTYLPSAGRGDVETASERYRHVLLIDGVFGERLAPSPREVAEASRRTRVYGAASMGALRSAECRTFGCTPLGIVARWYASGTIDGDDEVAIVMHPTREIALSVPSVNVRYTARLAVKRGILTVAEANGWVRDAREKIFYADRTWENAVEYAPERARDTLLALGERRGDLKRMDAAFALRCVRRVAERDGVAERSMSSPKIALTARPDSR